MRGEQREKNKRPRTGKREPRKTHRVHQSQSERRSLDLVVRIKLDDCNVYRM
jgi:hypothetical protein